MFRLTLDGARGAFYPAKRPSLAASVQRAARRYNEAELDAVLKHIDER